MTSNRLVVNVITQLIHRIETLESQQTTVHDDLSDVEKQVKRLAKELYKTNLLADDTAPPAPSTEDLQTLLAQLQQETTEQHQADITEARLDVVKAFIPVIDAVEAGLQSGVRQLKQLHQTHPQAAQMLSSWLKGQQLLRERLVSLLQAEGVKPIMALGQPFDPYLHVAVKAVSLPEKPPNIIIKVERSGYLYGESVLRFADVIVNKHN